MFSAAFFLFFLGGLIMREPSRLFNFQMPYEMYKKLERLKGNHDRSIAEIVRYAIGLLFKETEAEKSLEDKNYGGN